MLNTMKVQATITTTTTTVIAKMITKRKRNRRRLLLPMLIISLIVLSHGDRVDAATTGQLVKRSPILQRFLIEPDNLTVNIGESITLPCKVSNKAGTVQWTRDGFGLGTDPRLEGFPTYSMIHNDATGDYSLKISSVTLDDDATFQCQIGALDSVPGIRSQNAKLTVQVQPDRPVIVTGDFVNAPQSELQVLSTTAGTKVELTCEAHGGRPAAELAWLNSRNRLVKKGITTTVTPMNDGKRFNAALKWVFEPSKSDHNKRVTCRSSHPTMRNQSTAAILLEVKYAPEVKLEVVRIKASPATTSPPLSSNSLHAQVGDSLRIKCIADGNPGKETLVYEWFKDGDVLVGDHREEILFDNVDKSFHGVEIKCQVTNPVGVNRASVKLNIAYGPSFLSGMEYVHGVTSGDTVRLGCSVDGNPTPEITWIKVGSSSVMNTGPKLTIRNVNHEHMGEYLCRASVKGFAEVSAIVYLRLNGPPKIRKKRVHNYAVLDEPGHVECIVESVPPPIAITWIHNGQIFTSHNDGGSNVEISESRLIEERVALKATFDIKSTIQSDYGHYNCVVINKYGSDWHVISLDEQTSFSTIVFIILIFISVLVFIVMTTIIFLLSIKHRKLVKDQRRRSVVIATISDPKKQFTGDDADNHNIYSTTASTRTNSSSEKTAVGETGTIITRSGSTSSPRSSTSSFPAFLDSSGSPGPVVTSGGGQHTGHHHHHHHHHLSSSHHLHSPSFPEPPQSPYFTSPFDSHNSDLNNFRPNVDLMAPINYSTLTRQTPSLPNPYSFVPLYQYTGTVDTGSAFNRDLYQANPYPVSKVAPLLPTPTPTLAKELDTTKTSIATHV